MSRTLSSNFGVACARESSLGVLPGSPLWQTLQPNSIGKIGAETSTIVRQPISKNRFEYKGEVVDLDSSVELEGDLTMDHFLEFIEAFMMATWTTGVRAFVGTTAPTAVTATGYTVAALGDLAQDTLIYARGFPAAANNGLKVVGAGSTTTEIKTSGLTAESIGAPTGTSQNVSVEVCGVVCGTTDLVMTAGLNLTSTILDFTTLGLTVGQFIKIGGPTSGTQFATAANNGFARITAIAAHQLTLDWRSATFVADPGTGKTIYLLFGQFLRNVTADHASALTGRSYTFEAAYEDLEAIGTDAYEYPAGNMANEVTFGLPLTDKATMRVGFVGTDTPAPTLSRAANAANARRPVRTKMFNTVTNYARLSLNNVDETGISTDFKSFTISLRNNVSGERVQGTLGAKYINFGLFEAMIDATVLFTDPDVVAAIRDHTTVAFKMGLQNEDGGFFLDVPACTIGSGGKDFPTNQSVQLRAPLKPHVDDTLGYVLSFSHFPYLP